MKPQPRIAIAAATPDRVTLRVRHMLDYHGDLDARTISQGVRMGDKLAIEAMARALARVIQPTDFLVPMPGRWGYADRMLDVVEAMARRTGAAVHDVLRGPPRDSIYDTKKRSGPVHEVDLGLRAVAGAGTVILIDGVIDTGHTARSGLAALRGAGYRPLMLAFARSHRERKEKARHAGLQPLLQRPH